ncbi:hypothetical protein C8J56DRAFT_1165557 [Mycena floridula]|nr:hypothetical protein C8J56DRAFT_1165557 [Mycena floridula]
MDPTINIGLWQTNTTYEELTVADKELLKSVKRGCLNSFINLYNRMGADKFNVNKRIAHAEVADALFLNLGSKSIPSLQQTDSSAVSKAQMAISCLVNHLGDDGIDMDALMPILQCSFGGVIAWLDFFLSKHKTMQSYVHFFGASRLIHTRADVRHTTALLYLIIRISPEFLQKRIISDLRCVNCVALVCVAELQDVFGSDETDHQLRFMLWRLMNLMTPNNEPAAKKGTRGAQGFIDATDLGSKKFAKLIIEKLRSLTPTQTPDIILFLHNFIILLKVPAKDHPFITVCFEEGLIQLIVENLDQLAKQTTSMLDGDSPEHEAVITSFRFISAHIVTGAVVPWIVQAIKGRILSAYLSLYKYLSVDLTGFSECGADFLRATLPKYLVHRPVVRAAMEALTAMRADPKTSVMLDQIGRESSSAADAWGIFEDLVAHRSEQLPLVFVEPAVCGNIRCGNTGMESDFKKCSACQVTLFCDKEYFKTAWKLDHKEKCALLKKGEGKGQSVSFMNLLTIDEMVRNLDSLRKQAAEAYSHIPSADLMVHIDFTATPNPKFSICRVSEYWAKQKDDDRDSLTKHSERHCGMDKDDMRTRPHKYTITTGVFAAGEEQFRDAAIYSAGHWILDENFNGRQPVKFETGRDRVDFIDKFAEILLGSINGLRVGPDGNFDEASFEAKAAETSKKMSDLLFTTKGRCEFL